MHSTFALLTVGCAVFQTIAAGGISPYNAETASSLSSEGALLSETTVTKLLNVIAKHGLQNDYGVYALHEHFSYLSGEAPYEIPLSSSLSYSKVVDYSTIADSSVPLIFGVAADTSSLIPIEFVAKSTGTDSSYSTLSAAVSKGFVDDYVKAIQTLPAAEQPAVGLGMLTELTKGVLAGSSNYVLITADPKNNVKVATLESLSAAGKTGKSTSRPTLFGLSNEGKPRVLEECDECIFHMDD